MASEEDVPSTRERILDAALRLFARRGIEATSLDAVARDVGVRKQTLLYWFPSKDELVRAVVDETVSRIGDHLVEAAVTARPASIRADAGPELADRVRSVVDSVFRLGSTRPELFALVREVIRLGQPASGHLVGSIEPLVDSAVAALGPRVEADRVRAALLAAGARVIGLTTEAEILADLDLTPDLGWLRRRRASLRERLVADLS